MIVLGTMDHALAAIVGLMTAVVSWRVLRKHFGMDSPTLSICIGLLTGIGLASHEGGIMSGLLIPYEALGIAIVVMLFLIPFLKGKKEKDVKPLPPPRRNAPNMPADPWAREIRRGGKMAEQFKQIRRKQR